MRVQMCSGKKKWWPHGSIASCKRRGGGRCFTGLPGSSPGLIRWGLPEVQAWGFTREKRKSHQFVCLFVCLFDVYVGSSSRLSSGLAFEQGGHPS
jgi:hypothetical protein